MLTPPAGTLAKFDKRDYIAMLFLQGLLHARKQLQKYAFFSIPMLKKIRFNVKIQKISNMQGRFTCGIVWCTSLVATWFCTISAVKALWVAEV